VKVGRVHRYHHVGAKSFGLSCEDAPDKDDWRLGIIITIIIINFYSAIRS